MTTHLTQLWDRWNMDRDMDTANELLAHYDFLIHYHVQRMIVTLPKSVERDELKSLGYMGLYDALMKYDPEHNNKFDTYAAFSDTRRHNRRLTKSGLVTSVGSRKSKKNRSRGRTA